MTILRPRACEIGLAATVALLAGCNGSGVTQPGSENAMQRDVVPRARAMSAAVRANPDRGKSWMLPSAKKGSLLYVSDVGTNDVYVHTYPAGALVGTLKGFKEPQGECTDKNGGVWIVNTGASQIVKYAHGGTAIVATLKDPGQYPVGCAVDAAGDVAVTNVVTKNGGQGSIAWYAGGTGTPALISSPSFQEMYFDGFDAAGNLFVDGWPRDFAQTALGELRRGGKAIVPITIRGATIRYPGGVQFAGQTIDVGDQVDNAVFQIAENGTVTGYTPLDGAADCVQGSISGNRFVCPDSLNSAVDYFRYPAGGAPTRVISGLSEPTGSAISLSS